MEEDLIDRQCGLMSVPDLVRAVTLDRGNFSEGFLRAAMRELEDRGNPLGEFLDRVEVSADGGRKRESCTIDGGVKMLAEMELWTALIFANCLGEESLVVQREHLGWTVHHYRDDQYAKSFFVHRREDTERILRRFLLLEDWEELVDEEHDLDRWKVLVRSKAYRYLRKVEEELYKKGIPYTVQIPLFSRDERGQLAVLVPEEDRGAGQAVMEGVGKEIDSLYRRAEKRAAGGDLEGEIEVYGLLIEIVPDNPAIFYNRGSALFELERYGEAAASFIEAVSIGLDQASRAATLDPRARRSGIGRGIGGLGGMFGQLGAVFGLAGLLFDRSGGSRQEPPNYPDFIVDAELFLRRLLEKLPEDLPILHCLASIARLRDDLEAVEECYRRILAIDPQDRNAQLHLQYLRGDEQG